MTDLEAAVARILPAALVYPAAAPETIGHVLGLLARRHADPESVILAAMRTAVGVVREPAEIGSYKETALSL